MGKQDVYTFVGSQPLVIITRWYAGEDGGGGEVDTQIMLKAGDSIDLECIGLVRKESQHVTEKDGKNG